MKKLGIGLILILSLSVCLMAQEISGKISGIVKDETGLPLPGALVTITNADRGYVLKIQTNETGYYLAPNLAPGDSYSLKVETPGFETQIKHELSVHLGQTTVSDFILDVAAFNITVVVNEKAPVLETQKGEVSFQVDEKTLNNLPFGRNVYDIVFLEPGVAPTGSDDFSNGSGFSVNGQRGRSNNFVLDGQQNNDPTVTGPMLSLRNPEIIKEVQIITNSYKAEYGRNMGSVVNIVTRGGTNQFHGTANFHHLNSKFSSLNNLEKNANYKEKPHFVQHQYGLAIDGPIKKDKLFFLGYFQKEEFRGSNVSPTYVAPTALGQQTLRNLRNQGLINAVTTDLLLNFVPPANGDVLGSLPIGLGRPPIELGLLTGSLPNLLGLNNYGGRIDFQKDERNAFFGKFMVQDAESPYNGSILPKGSGYAVDSSSKNGGIVWDKSVSVQSFNRLQFLAGDFKVNFGPENNQPFGNMPEIILDSGLGSPLFFGVPTSFPQDRKIKTYQIQDQFMWLKGKHSYKTGAEISVQRTDINYLPLQRGRLLYLSAGGVLGFTNFLDNYASFGTQWFGPNTYYPNLLEQAYFFQDDWRIRPNLTLNYGLRYENGGQPNNLLHELSQGEIAQLDTDSNNFAPRFGFAWVPKLWLLKDDRTVVRGGAGLSYDPAGGFLNITINSIHSPPIVRNGTFFVPSSLRGFPNAYPNALPILQHLAEAGDITTQFQTSMEPGFRAPKAEHYSLGIQRELPAANVLSVMYVGSRGLGLYQSLDGNPFLPETGARLFPQEGQRRIRSNASASTYHSLQLQWQKRFDNNLAAVASYAFSKSIDDASEIFDAASSAFAQDPFNRRLDRGLSAFHRKHVLTIHYIYQPPVLEWHRFKKVGWSLKQLTRDWQISGISNFVSGQPFTIRNGWDSNYDQPPFYSANDRPDLGNPEAHEQSVALSADLYGVFSPTGFIDANYNPVDPKEVRFVQVVDGIGNSSRSALFADGITNFNLGVFRNWKVRSLRKDWIVQLQTQIANLFNTRDYGGFPDATIGSKTFLNYGETTLGNSRDILFGLKIIF